MIGLSLMVTSFNGDVTNLKLEQNGKSSLIMGIINHVAIIMTFSSTKIFSSTTFYTITANTTINGVQAGAITGGSTKGGYYVIVVIILIIEFYIFNKWSMID